MYQPQSSTSPHHTNHQPSENHTPNTPPNHLTNHPPNAPDLIPPPQTRIFRNGHHVHITPYTHRYTTRNTNHNRHTKTTVTLTTTTTSVQRDTRHHSPAAGWETNQVFHHIPHVHERRAIGSFLNEHERRKVTSKNHDKKHYRQKIVNHTNNNLIVNFTNQKLQPPLKSMLTKGLKFIPTPDNTRLKTIFNSFKQFRRSMYIHYHFRNSSNDHPNPFKNH